MHSLDKSLPVVLGGLIGAAIGVVGSSLLLSAYYARTGALKWHDLNDIASFWNGHLAIAGLFILGVGLYLQSRAEQQQFSRYRAEYLRSSLATLASRIGELEEHLRAYQVNSRVHPVEVASFIGIRQVATAVFDSATSPDGDLELWVEHGSLRAYASAAAQVRAMHNSLLQCSPEDSTVDYVGMLCDVEVCKYADMNRTADVEFMKELESQHVDAADLRDITVMREQGWRIELRSTHARYFVIARMLFPNLRRVEVVHAESEKSVKDACADLASQWRRKWGTK